MSFMLALSDVLALFAKCLSLSLMAVGGGMTALPEIHRYLVGEKSWLTDAQFTSSIALAQSAPGPNILYMAMLGWNTGMNGGGYGFALLCVAACMLGILIPSTVLTLLVTRWAHRNREWRGLRAFKQGMAPIVIALLMSTVWLLGSVHNNPATDWRLWLLAAAGGLALLKTRISLLWILGAGAVLGGLGWV